MTKSGSKDTFAYSILKMEDGMYAPAKLRISGGFVREKVLITEPCPYLALAYQALEAAIAQEYLASTLRAPKPAAPKPKED